MTKATNIYVKIQIERNETSGDLMLRTHFDPKAPNFYQEKNDISWCPTPDEIDFINESFELLPKGKRGYTPTKRKKTDSTSSSEKEKTDEPPKENTDDPPKDEREIDQEFESVQESEETDEKKEVIVSADGKTVDEIIKKKMDGSDEFMIEADEETILDKVLKQKKKGKL